MPIFEFRCKNCGKVIEELVMNGEEMPRRCPHCGGELERIFSGSVGLSFKGAGFYVNDYGKGCTSCQAAKKEGSGEEK
ncbi:MAG: zinc ribbon domain-containing protein [candidate division WOR-3 bacterium]